MIKKIGQIVSILILFAAFSYSVWVDDIGSAAVMIVYPSKEEQTIAPGRDFYCVGQVAAGYANQVQSVSFCLCDEHGQTVRQISSGASDFNIDYQGIKAYNQENAVWLMPDIVYDAADPDSFAYSWNKCYYRQGYALGLISGGSYQGYIDHENQDGSDFAQICPGKTYTLQLAVTLNNGKILTARQKILMSSSADKVLTRFSPDNHLTKVTENAVANDYRLYLDLFPGYWSPASIITEAANDPYFAEIMESWQYADALEYQKGDVRFYLYNITATSACNCVELATLQLLGDIDRRLHIYYMNIGEPELVYTSLVGEKQKIESEYLLLDKGDTLQLLRVEQRKGVAAVDNVYYPYQSQVKNVDVDLMDGVNVCVGDTITIFGLVTPIQNKVEEISRNAGFSYTIGNLIDKVCYGFTARNGKTITVQKDVALTRYFAEDQSDTSIYEYAHSFVVAADMIGGQKVDIYALDTYGNRVKGSDEQLLIYVDKEGTFGDVADEHK